MANKPMTAQDVQDLFKPKPKIKEKPQTVRFPAPPQHGPLRYMEQSALCVVSGYYKYDDEGNKEWVKTHGGCRSQTHYRLQGIPMCSTHALRAMNEMLIDANVDLKEFITDDSRQMEIEHDKQVITQLIKANDEHNSD